MGIVYLNAIKALKGYKNNGVNEILYNIARNFNLLNNNKIMYRELYREILHPWLKQKYNYHMSYKQYRRLCINHRGRIPKKAANYLYGFYMIMLSYDSNLTKKHKNVGTYSDFTMHREKDLVNESIIAVNDAFIYSELVIKEFKDFLSSLCEMDQRIYKQKGKKIFNDF